LVGNRRLLFRNRLDIQFVSQILRGSTHFSTTQRLTHFGFGAQLTTGFSHFGAQRFLGQQPPAITFPIAKIATRAKSNFFITSPFMK
jgi:hypothetical protein